MGSQVNLVERTIKYLTLPADLIDGHVTSRNQGLFQRLREAEKRDPGNEVDQLVGENQS